ncbi:MAG TPA: serine protease [Pyrinomonadaceae bacterium]|jgi:S1-C subfamily serine protease
MKRGICVLVLAALVSHTLASVETVAAEDPLSAVLRRGGRAVSLDLKVRKKKPDSLQRFLEMLDGSFPNAYATGFVVGDGLVMTAYHVVSGGLSAQKRDLLGFSHDEPLKVEAYVNGCAATVIKIDPDADLALLRVCGTKKQVGELAFQPAPAPDEMLHVIARPNGGAGGRMVKRGAFSGLYKYRGHEYLSAKIEGRDGFSGSPVYNGRGELVGVFSGYDSTRKVALISPAARAQKLLEDYASGLRAAPPNASDAPARDERRP